MSPSRQSSTDGISQSSLAGPEVAASNPAPLDHCAEAAQLEMQGPTRLDWKRLWMAFALTPMLSGFYPAIFLAEPSVMPLAFLLAYTSALVVGVPLVLWLDRRYWRHWWQFGLAGLACTLPTIALYGLVTPPVHLDPFGWMPALGILFWGSASGLVFWLIGVLGDTRVSLRTLFDPLTTRH